jgi:hypothetical protein
MARISGTLWEGVALRRTKAGADPDAEPRQVALPATWDEDAAAALAALAPGEAPVALPRAAEAWIGRATSRGRRAGVVDEAGAHALAEGLRALLLTRRATAGAETWRGDTRAEPRFVLNLPAFLEPEGGFDLEGYAEACALGVRLLECLGQGKSARLRLGFADLAGLLASLAIAYDSAEGRAIGAAIAALTRGSAEAESGCLAVRLGAREPVALIWPAPPAATRIPGLSEAARAALDAAAASPAGLRHVALVMLAPADAAEALLGVETAGLAPAAGATHPVQAASGEVFEAPTRAALRASAAAPDRVAELLAPVPEAARKAMADGVAPFLHAAPPVPLAIAGPSRPLPRAATMRRHAGTTLHVTVGGHRVALRTAEDGNGKLLEISFTLSKEAAAYRSLMDAFAQSVSLGLQQGAPLADYVESFAYTRFGPAGVVEGDPAITRATSVLDWAFRRLALDYLGRRDLPEPTEDDCAPDSLGTATQQAPLLPLDLPQHAGPAASPRSRRRSFRVVG